MREPGPRFSARQALGLPRVTTGFCEGRVKYDSAIEPVGIGRPGRRAALRAGSQPGPRSAAGRRTGCPGDWDARPSRRPSNTQSNRDQVRLRGPAKSSAALALHRRTAIVAAASSRTPPESCFSAFSTLNQLCAPRRISESDSFRRTSRAAQSQGGKPATPGDPLRFADAEHQVITQHVRRAGKESVRHAARHAARFLTRTVSDQLSPGAMWGPADPRGRSVAGSPPGTGAAQPGPAGATGPTPARTRRLARPSRDGPVPADAWSGEA